MKREVEVRYFKKKPKNWHSKGYVWESQALLGLMAHSAVLREVTLSRSKRDLDDEFPYVFTHTAD